MTPVALTGRLPLLMLLGLVPVAVRPQLSTVWLWAATVLALSALDWWLAPRPTALTVTRDRLLRVRQGEPTSTTLRLRAPATGRRLHGVVRDAWQPSAGATGNRHPLSLRRGEEVAVTTSLLPTRRGDLRAVGTTVRLVGPLGLAARQATLPVPGALRVVPAFPARKHLPSRLARLRELDGRAAVRVRGRGTEFDSLRDYVRGDDVRAIDWRASARHPTVVVRTWQPERDRRVVLVLDTSRTSAARVEEVPRLDASMDAALLLTALASRAGDRVDFVAGDRTVRSRLRLAGREGSVGRVEQAMADLHPVIAEADWRALASAVTALGRQRALVVLLTALEPAVVEESLLPVLPVLVRHHRLVLASVQDPALTEMSQHRGDLAEVYGAAAAEQVLVGRRRTAEALGALGVDVVDVPAGQLAPALADHYLALKARGLL